MAYSFCVSLPESEKELYVWLQEKIRKNEISVSNVFRSAIVDLKKLDDVRNSQDLNEMRRKMEIWYNMNDIKTKYLEEKGLLEEFNKYKDKKEIAQHFAKKGIEIIEPQNKEVIEVQK